MIVICKKECKIKVKSSFPSCCGDTYQEYKIGEAYNVFSDGGKVKIGGHLSEYGTETTVEFLRKNFEELKIWQ